MGVSQIIVTHMLKSLVWRGRALTDIGWKGTGDKLDYEMDGDIADMSPVESSDDEPDDRFTMDPHGHGIGLTPS